MTKEELWQATLAQLQFQISPANFATWLKNTYVFSQKEGLVAISVPNNFSKEWLEQKYNKLIFKILRTLDLDIKEVSYTVERQAPRQKEQAQQSRVREEPQETQLEFQELKVDKLTNLSARYSFDNFVVGPFNELAHAASLAVTKSPGSTYNPLFIYGGTGLGKTHLLQAVGNQIAKELSQKKIRYMPSERFTSNVVTAIRNRTIDTFRSSWRELDILILDDVQFLAGKDKTQEELFHTFNTLYEKGKQIIFSSDRPPKAIPALEERLRSRFEGGMIADISSPDFETRIAIMKSKAQEKNVEVPDDIASYVASNIQRNIRELEGAITRLIAFSQVNSRSPSLQEAKGLLKNVIQAPSKFVTPKRIIQAVSEFYDLKEKEIIAASRKQEVVRPRQIAMYLLRGELRSSYPFIGNRFGGKDHTTAIYACEKIEKELQSSESLVEEINLIRQRIYSV